MTYALRTAGRWLASEGYRGIFGCDYLVTPTGEEFAKFRVQDYLDHIQHLVNIGSTSLANAIFYSNSLEEARALRPRPDLLVEGFLVDDPAAVDRLDQVEPFQFGSHNPS